MDKYDELIKRMLESEAIQQIYEEFIVKDITFKEFVIGRVDDMLIKEANQNGNSM